MSDWRERDRNLAVMTQLQTRLMIGQQRFFALGAKNAASYWRKWGLKSAPADSVIALSFSKQKQKHPDARHSVISYPVVGTVDKSYKYSRRISVRDTNTGDKTFLQPHRRKAVITIQTRLVIGQRLRKAGPPPNIGC